MRSRLRCRAIAPTFSADRHLVVVEDHDDVGVDVLGVVHTFEGKPAGHCAVADDRHHVLVATAQVPGLRQTERR